MFRAWDTTPYSGARIPRQRGRALPFIQHDKEQGQSDQQLVDEGHGTMESRSEE